MIIVDWFRDEMNYLSPELARQPHSFNLLFGIHLHIGGVTDTTLLEAHTFRVKSIVWPGNVLGHCTTCRLPSWTERTREVVSGPRIVLLDHAAIMIAAVVVMVMMVVAEVGPVEELVQGPAGFEAGLNGWRRVI